MSAPRKSSPARKTRILIIDDHPMMREGLGLLIRNEADLEVCGEAGDGQEGLAQVSALRPDLVITDISMPGKSGLELIKDIQAIHAGTLTLVISMHDESFYAERVLRAGGRGYIMKQEGGQKLLAAIRQVLAGKIYVSEKMSARILETMAGGKTEASTSPVEKLTDREFEVFQLIGSGLNTGAMAERLHVSPKTIEVHRASIKTKLGLGTAAELLRYAVRWQETQKPG